MHGAAAAAAAAACNKMCWREWELNDVKAHCEIAAETLHPAR